jgi:hypothetical protein
VHHGLEDLRVAVRRTQPELISGRAGDQQAAVGIPHQPAQPEHVDADQVAGLGRGLFPPGLLDQLVDRHDLPGPDQQGSQHGTPFRGSDPLPLISRPDLKRSEQPEPHHYPGSPVPGQIELGGQKLHLIMTDACRIQRV